jgi:hypothetical protein
MRWFLAFPEVENVKLTVDELEFLGCWKSVDFGSVMV